MPRHRPLLAAALAALAALAAPPARAARAQDTIPLRPLWGRLKSVRVLVAGDSLDFLFDTGGSVTLISRELAARLGCTPTGRQLGFRMTGEMLSGQYCPGVALRVGPLAVRADAGVADMAKVLDRPAPGVHGEISLQSFVGRVVTVDLAGNRLILETPRSLAARARAMTPVPMRVSTGLHGGEATAFLGIPTNVTADRRPAPAQPGEGPPTASTTPEVLRSARDDGPRARAMLWLEFDTGHQAATFLAPHAARMLGLGDSVRQGDVEIALGARRVVVPARVKDVIHDGVLSAAFIGRAVYTLDLAGERAWVGPVASIPALAEGAAHAGPARAEPAPPAADPTGRYEITPIVRGRPEPGVLVVTRRDGALVGEFRGLGDDASIPVRDLTVDATTDGPRLRFTLVMGTPTPFDLTFDGLTGHGRWADGAQHGGEASAVKRS